MKIYIDQSGKIEDTSKDTVLAISNGLKYTVFLPAKTKRVLQAIFRKENRPEMFIYLVFSSLLFILLKLALPKSKVIVDKEYPGKESLIKILVEGIIQESDCKKKLDFEFGLVGKSSNVHGLAHKTYTKKLKADKIVKLEEIVKLVYLIKNDRVSAY